MMAAVTLVLNARTFEPLCVVPRHRALGLVLADKARVLEAAGVLLHAPTGQIVVPSVIRLTDYVPMPYQVGPLRFTKAAVLARDGHRCAYCQQHATTVDHVFPRALGGKWTFENCVAACVDCNQAKADKTLEELGWTLPFTPTTPLGPRTVRWRTAHPRWEAYLTAA